MPKKTLTVLICALNEEKNIGFLIQDILDQEFSDAFGASFDLEQVVVVSDGSKDETAEIVKEFSKKDHRVFLIENEKRIGKIFSLDKVFHLIDADYIVLFDADVRLKKDTIGELVRPFVQKDFDLIGGNPIPIKPSSFFNIAEQASYFSWLLLRAIKKRQPDSIYSAHGRILSVSKNLYKKLDMRELATPGDDQYMYLKSEHDFQYQKDAVVFYRMPSTVEDYLKQSVRFRRAKLTYAKSLNADIVRKEFDIKGEGRIFLGTFLGHPYKGICWGILYVIGYFKFQRSKTPTDIDQVWGEVTSTK